MKNQAFAGTPTNGRFVPLPTTVLAGDAILVGKEPGVARDSYQSNLGGAVVYFGGSFYLSVTAKSSLSPSTGAAIGVGDKIYADGGTLDATTNVTTGFTLDANSSSGVLFGFLDPQGTKILTTVTDTAAVVRLQGAE